MVLTFSKMHVTFGTVDHLELHQVCLLSKRYRIALLTFNICPLNAMFLLWPEHCSVKCPCRTVFTLLDEATVHLMGQYCTVDLLKG